MTRDEAVKIQNTDIGNTFWPRDGFCFSCKGDVLADQFNMSIAHMSMVTGCPHCKRSFVE